MRRLMLVLSLVLLGFASSPQPAAAVPGRGTCEGYCAIVAGGCYIILGLFIGKEKCDSMYEGCVEGCLEGLLDPEPERE